MTSPHPVTAGRSARPLAMIVTYAIAGAFLAVGVLGFVPGVTTHYDTLAFAGHQSGALLFGLFAVSILHNLVHLAFGAAGLLMARTAVGARVFLIGGGVIYLLLWIYGLVIDKDSGANVIPLNTADDWLHFGLGLGMITLGLCWAEPPPGARPAPPNSGSILFAAQGGHVTVVSTMLGTYPADLGRVDRDVLTRCIEECLTCAHVCTACADACLSESDEDLPALRKCVRSNEDCADICAATARILSRHTGYDANLTRAMLAACEIACRSCGDECGRHASRHEQCRLCAEACRRCEQACRALTAALG